MLERKIGFIGAGNMGTAIIQGIISKFDGINKNIFINDRDLSKTEKISKEFNINQSINNQELVKNVDILILAVKPNVYGKVLEEIKGFINEKHILVSIAAGISIEFIQSFFKDPIKIIRTMPNTPALVGEGMTAVSKNTEINDEELELVLKIFESLGMVDVIEEEMMDIIPAISGSSPAYVYMLIEAMADGGVLQGLPREKAYQYAAQAVLGAAKMVLETGKHPGELKDQVCSPGGTTIEAVYAMEKNHFRATVIEGMEACTMKARRMTESS